MEKAQCLPALLSLQEAGSADERQGAMACLAQLLPAAGGPGALMVLEQVPGPGQNIFYCMCAANLKTFHSSTCPPRVCKLGDGQDVVGP